MCVVLDDVAIPDWVQEARVTDSDLVTVLRVGKSRVKCLVSELVSGRG